MIEMKVFGLALGLLLAFTLVQTQNYQRQASTSISSEASVLNRMDRLLARST